MVVPPCVHDARTLCSNPLPATGTHSEASRFCLSSYNKLSILLDLRSETNTGWLSGVNRGVRTSFHPSSHCPCSKPLGVCRAVPQPLQAVLIPALSRETKKRYLIDAELTFILTHSFIVLKSQLCFLKPGLDVTIFSAVPYFQDNPRKTVESLGRIQVRV